jgi:hypothetical protein
MTGCRADGRAYRTGRTVAAGGRCQRLELHLRHCCGLRSPARHSWAQRSQRKNRIGFTNSDMDWSVAARCMTRRCSNALWRGVAVVSLWRAKRILRSAQRPKHIDLPHFLDLFQLEAGVLEVLWRRASVTVEHTKAMGFQGAFWRSVSMAGRWAIGGDAWGIRGAFSVVTWKDREEFAGGGQQEALRLQRWGKGQSRAERAL